MGRKKNHKKEFKAMNKKKTNKKTFGRKEGFFDIPEDKRLLVGTFQRNQNFGFVVPNDKSIKTDKTNVRTAKIIINNIVALFNLPSLVLPLFFS